MAYPGITFVLMVSVAIGSAIYYYLNGDWGQQQQQQQNQRHHGYRNDDYDIPNMDSSRFYSRNTSRSASPDSNASNSSRRRRKAAGREECSICLQVMNPHTTKTLGCGHMYHIKCILKWFEAQPKNTCPLCRSE